MSHTPKHRSRYAGTTRIDLRSATQPLGIIRPEPLPAIVAPAIARQQVPVTMIVTAPVSIRVRRPRHLDDRFADHVED